MIKINFPMSNFIQKFLPLFIYFIIFVKFIFLISSITNLLSTKKIKKDEKENKEENEKLLKIQENSIYWKERTEFIFIISTSFLLIFIFNPHYDNLKYLNKEIKLLFFLFGWILIFTSNWNYFISESPSFWKIKKQ